MEKFPFEQKRRIGSIFRVTSVHTRLFRVFVQTTYYLEGRRVRKDRALEAPRVGTATVIRAVSH